MADRFWGRITIGGSLRRNDMDRFCREAEIRTDEIADFIEDGRFVREDGEARYGRFEDLEKLCRELGLPYIRQSDGRYEYSPEYSFWTPGMDSPVSVLLDHGANMTAAMDDVRAALAVLREGDAARAEEMLVGLVVDLPELPEFRVGGE